MQRQTDARTTKQRFLGFGRLTDKLLTALLVISILAGCSAMAVDQGQTPYSPSLPEDRPNMHNGGDGGGGSM